MIIFLTWIFVGHLFWLACMYNEPEPPEATTKDAILAMLITWCLGPFIWIAWWYRESINVWLE